MHFLSRFKALCTDFLFPKSRKVLELEAIPTGTLLEILPPAERLRDKEVFALFDYSHPLTKTMVWELKYNGNRKIAEKLGEILYDAIRQELEDFKLFENWDKPILVPIPISDKRRFERGWNQSELLSEQFLTRDNEKIFRFLPRQLVKYRHTESQTETVTRIERLKNLTDSMRVINREAIAGECVIVLDDVTTTGSTFAEAKRALYESGAKKILCVAVAH